MDAQSPDWFSNVTDAHQVKNYDAVEWAEEADLVVVGLGGAGVATALQGMENGLTVITLDKFAGGGATKASGGVFYAGGGTQMQKDAGIEDTPQNMFEYLKLEVEGIVSEETLKRFCDTSVETYDWLVANGVEFRSTHWPSKTSYPGPEYFLYHSDNTLVSNIRKKIPPSARGHRGFVPIEQGRKAINLGGSIFDPLKETALQKGMMFHDYTEVRTLVTDEAGRVCGVKVDYFEDEKSKKKYINYLAKANRYFMMWPPILPGYKFFAGRGTALLMKARQLEGSRQTRFIGAKKAVMLSAGGFVYNREMMAHYAPKFTDTLPLGTDGDSGAGIRLGQSVSGKIDNMHRISPWRFINPPFSFAKGIIVNKHGRRFINETVYGATMGVEIGEHQEGKAWLILNRALTKAALAEVSGGKALSFQRDLARLNVWFGSVKADTLEALAGKTGLPLDALTEEITTYQKAVAGIQEDSFGKDQSEVSDLTDGPYYALDISLNAKLFPCPAITLGGLVVDESTGEVLNDQGRPVAGLYASGRNAVGICSQNYVSGLSISDCVFSGRRAADHIAGKQN
ncbi:MAG: FAD-binding protein [Parvibaculales bacterium]